MTEKVRRTVEGFAGQELLRIGSATATYVGIDISDDASIVDETVLEFTNSRLSIENPFLVFSGRSDQPLGSPDILVGKRVLDAYSTGEALVVKFEGDLSLSISLRDEDFSSPEAANYSPNHGPIMVFD